MVKSNKHITECIIELDSVRQVRFDCWYDHANKKVTYKVYSQHKFIFETTDYKKANEAFEKAREEYDTPEVKTKKKKK